MGTLSIGRIGDDYVVRLEGRGGVQESSTFRDYARLCLERENSRVTLDLNECEHLDSTFLGCLVGLFKSYGTTTPTRFYVAAQHHTCKRLLSTSRIDLFLKLVDAAPESSDEMRRIEMCTLGVGDMGRHVMRCHQLLAELGGPDAEAFTRIAKRLGHELEELSSETQGKIRTTMKPRMNTNGHE